MVSIPSVHASASVPVPVPVLEAEVKGPSLKLQDLLGRIAQHTDDVILITEAEPIDLPGPRIVYVNAAFTRMTGYASEEAIGLTPRMLQGLKTSREACRQIRAALDAWRPIRIELLNYRKDGSEFWVELHITPVTDDTGLYRYWVSVQRETNERRHFDEQRRLYELILANVNDGIVVADALRPDFPIEFINDGFTRMTGYTRADVQDVNCRLLQGPDTDPMAKQQLRRGIEQQVPVTTEILNYRKDGNAFWNLITITPLRDAQGTVVKYVGVQRDLTDAKLREREMVAAQRLKAVGEMTGGIAHDFNNLLTAISGAAELLVQRFAHDADNLPLIQVILAASHRGTGQVRRLLGFTRTPLLARGPLDLRPVLRQLELMLRSSLRENISLAIDLHPAARWIDAEPVQLEAALLNLVLNAQDAIAQDGAIRITSQPVTEHGRPMVALEVSDTGVGMDGPTLARVFEPFFTTKAVGRGSGLGLAMVNAFAAAIGGHVTVRSTVGQGSVFVLTVPAIPQGETEHGELHGASAESCVPFNVLLVEDDEVARITAIAMLESLGHRVQACADANEALALLERDASVQVLFTDLMMPGSMGGLELATVARERRPWLRVILTSGWADSDLPAELSQGKADTFVLKPYSLADLSRAFATI